MMKKFWLPFLRLKNSKGFTVTEVVVTAVVLLGAIITLISVFDMAVKLLVTTNVRTLATIIANQEIETIRDLDYEKIANDIPAQWPNDSNLIVDNFPTEPAHYVDINDNNQVTTFTLETTTTGSVKMEEQLTRKNFTYTVRRYIALVPPEATSTFTAYYKRVIVKVTWTEAPVNEIVVRTNIAKEDIKEPAPTVKILGIKSSFYDIYTNTTYDETQSMGDYVRDNPATGAQPTVIATARHNSAKASGIKQVTFTLYRPDGSIVTSSTVTTKTNGFYQYSFDTTPSLPDGYGYVIKAEATDDSREALTDSTSIKFGIDNTPPTFTSADPLIVNDKAPKMMEVRVKDITDNMGLYKIVLRRINPDDTQLFIAALSPSDNSETVFIDAGLEPQKKYSYRIRLVDKAGNYTISTDRGRDRTTPASDNVAPQSPTGITTDTVSWRTNNLWWVPPPDTDTAGYHIFSSKDGINYTVVGQVGVSGNTTETFQDVDLRANSWHWYFLKAYDKEGNFSTASTVVKILTPGR